MITHKELDDIFYRIEQSCKKFTEACISGGFEKDEPQLEFLIRKRWNDLLKIEKAFVLWGLYNDILEEDSMEKMKKIIKEIK